MATDVGNFNYGQFRQRVNYRTKAVNRLNVNVGERPIYGIPYLRNNRVPFESRTKLSRDMATSRGTNVWAPKLAQTESAMKGGQRGGDIFKDIGKAFKSVEKSAEKKVKEVAHDVEGAVKAVDKYVSQDDLVKQMGRDIAKMANEAEQELKDAGEDIEQSAKAGTLISDGLKLTAKITDKYGADIAGTLAGSIAAAAGGGFIGKQIANKLTKQLVKETGADEAAAKEIGKLGRAAEKAGFGTDAVEVRKIPKSSPEKFGSGNVQQSFYNTSYPGHNRLTAGRDSLSGRAKPHFSHYDGNKPVPGDRSNRGARAFDSQSFRAIHPLNFRKASIQ